MDINDISSSITETPGVAARSRPLVLIVEDDRDNALLIARVLTAARYDFLMTSTGLDALHHATTIRPDAITLDLRLPDIDGLSVLDQLKAAPETRDIPVVIISIVADERDPRLSRAFATISKPIDRESLRHTVESAIQSRLVCRSSGASCP